MVSPDRRSWHCFGCGEGGDVFAFLMKRENIEFGEALRILAERAGVELRRVNPSEHKFAGLLFELNALACEWFREKYLETPVAREYLEKRKLAPETINEFEIGWAPNDLEGLVVHLLKKNYDPQDIIRAGLAFQTDRGRILDRFRGRIMFPIHNHFGKVVGFTGRILPQFDTGEMGKYVNSPETPIFQKSKLLYGYWKTKNNIREAGSAFLVEGQMDFLMSYQAGVKTAIASSGTALTEDHLRTLRRSAEELLVTFDNDPAGAAAAERAIDLAEMNEFSVRVVVIPEPHKDPADAVMADPVILTSAIAAAVPAPEFYFRKHLSAGPLDRRDREQMKNLRIILGKLMHIASPVERDYWLRELGKRAGIDESALREEASRISAADPAGFARESARPAPAESPVMERAETRQKTRRETLSERLVGAAF
ncbi:MAG: DNA primase, partial [Patescibacteria group bacterium]